MLAPKATSGVAELPLDSGTLDFFTITSQGTLPRGDGGCVSLELEHQVAKVILNHGVPLHLLTRLQEQHLGKVEAIKLEVRPSEAVEIRTIVRVDLDRALEAN